MSHSATNIQNKIEGIDKTYLGYTEVSFEDDKSNKFLIISALIERWLRQYRKKSSWLGSKCFSHHKSSKFWAVQVFDIAINSAVWLMMSECTTRQSLFFVRLKGRDSQKREVAVKLLG